MRTASLIDLSVHQDARMSLRTIRERHITRGESKDRNAGNYVIHPSCAYAAVVVIVHATITAAANMQGTRGKDKWTDVFEHAARFPFDTT